VWCCRFAVHLSPLPTTETPAHRILADVDNDRSEIGVKQGAGEASKETRCNRSQPILLHPTGDECSLQYVPVCCWQRCGPVLLPRLFFLHPRQRKLFLKQMVRAAAPPLHGAQRTREIPQLDGDGYASFTSLGISYPSSLNGLNPDWNSTPNGLNAEWDSTSNFYQPQMV
jgi:hypothetical protein